MDGVRGLFLGMPHGTTPAAVTINKNIIMRSFKSSGDIQKKEGGPDSCVRYNNKCSQLFDINAGVVHGDPLSPILFIF